MLGEPPRSEYDLNFRIFDFPVRVHPYFWLLAVLLGMRGSAQEVIIWVAVVFVSILVHELGHAFAIRYFGADARIVLHSFGGLAITEQGYRSRNVSRTPTTQVLISLAGPFAGFGLALLVVAALYLTQHSILFPFFGSFERIGQGTELPWYNNSQTGEPALPIAVIALKLLQVNFYWGLLNLMPIYPLDGGQVARQLFVVNADDGVAMSLQLSLATAGVLAALALINGETYMALMFGYMGYMNYQQLFGGGFGRRPW